MPYFGSALGSASLRHGRQGDRAGRSGRFGDTLVFTVPVLLPVESSVGGQLFLAEVVLLVALPFLLDHARRRGVSRIPHGVVALGGLWLLGLMASDIYRGTSFHNYSRGWANVAFLLVDVAGVALLIDGRWRRVTLFAAGLAVGEVLRFYVNPDVYAASYPWKFGYGDAVTLAGVLIASRPSIHRRPAVAVGVMVGLGVVNLKMGYRSLGGVCLLTAFTVMFAAHRTRALQTDWRPIRTMASLAVSALAGIIIVSAYGYAAGHGVLGARAEQKYYGQQGQLGILVGGRPELVSETLAIRDSPIIGHGSWAQGAKYAAALPAELFRLGYASSEKAPTSALIPTHSYVFGAWVDAGLLGALFWWWVLGRVAALLPRLARIEHGNVILAAFLAFSMLWAILFSPLGGRERLTAAFALVVLELAWKETQAYGRRVVYANE